MTSVCTDRILAIIIIIIIIIIVTEQTAQLICSGKKSNHNEFSYVVTKDYSYRVPYNVCSSAEKESILLLSMMEDGKLFQSLIDLAAAESAALSLGTKRRYSGIPF